MTAFTSLLSYIYRRSTVPGTTLVLNHGMTRTKHTEKDNIMNAQSNTVELSGPASLMAAIGVSVSMIAVVTLLVSSIAFILG